MKKKLQIFVSSTYKDLKIERQAAVEAILESGHIPAGMELFAAGDKSQLETIKKWIDASDIYMLILGARYGSIEPDSKLSYIEVEYNYAFQKGKPLFAVVISEEEIKKRENNQNEEFVETENIEKLNEFRKIVLSKTSSFFSDAKDVKLAIHRSVNELIEDYDFVGWIRGNYAKTEEELQKVNDMYEYINKLEKEIDNLRNTIGKDTLNLVQGDNIVELDFTISQFSLKDKFTWDDLFLVIAKQCLKGNLQNSEGNIKIAVVDFIGNKIGLNNRDAILRSDLFNDNFEKIKIQFLALEFIDVKMQFVTSNNKLIVFWSLTLKGQRHYTDILAIKKS